jgi:hypothetical protein
MYLINFVADFEHKDVMLHVLEKIALVIQLSE